MRKVFDIVQPYHGQVRAAAVYWSCLIFFFWAIQQMQPPPEPRNSLRTRSAEVFYFALKSAE